jgi:hypothetical protein
MPSIIDHQALVLACRILRNVPTHLCVVGMQVSNTHLNGMLTFCQTVLLCWTVMSVDVMSARNDQWQSGTM